MGQTTDNSAIRRAMSEARICVIIPTYDNERTLASVVGDALKYAPSVIVVNDGSTDGTPEILQSFGNRIDVVSYTPNRGKGHALRRGFDRAEEKGFCSAITMDSDGQHFASDIPGFVLEAEKNPGALLVGERAIEGDMPSKNTFANKFSNFWIAVQTGHKLNDTQNGFRLYPLAEMRGMRPHSSRYEAESELFVRCAWKGISIASVPTRVYYPPESERVTHFRPGKDFFRISVVNALCVLLAIVYGYPSMLFHRLFAKKKTP